MSEIDQDLYRKIIEQGLAEILTRAVVATEQGLPSLQRAVTGEELSDAMVKALKAYTEANN
jgi:hypothetical protein